MKKVFSALVLTSLLAVLVLPTIVLAADPVCPQCSNPTVQCRCAGGTYPAGAIIWCFNGNQVFTDLAECQAAMGTNGVSGNGYQTAPTYITTAGGLIDLITRIGNWIFTIVLALAGIFLIVAGYFFITASGNPEGVNKARTMLINALIGVAVAVGAKGLVLVIQNIVAGG